MVFFFYAIDRVGIELPTIEVRYENLSIDAETHVGSRGLPTLIIATMNAIEVVQMTQNNIKINFLIFFHFISILSDWVSFLAYPNLFGIKVFIVVVVMFRK
jgi:ABC-transporter N-terminal